MMIIKFKYPTDFLTWHRQYVLQKIKLCDAKKLELIDHFVTWVVDEKL